MPHVLLAILECTEKIAWGQAQAFAQSAPHHHVIPVNTGVDATEPVQEFAPNVNPAPTTNTVQAATMPPPPPVPANAQTASNVPAMNTKSDAMAPLLPVNVSHVSRAPSDLTETNVKAPTNRVHVYLVSVQ